jgi:cysteinyl-tRNA synthetase
VVDIEPAQPGRFSFYACGPTVYDLPHIGHGRQSLVYDVLRRYLTWSGVEVNHVSNVTDIDDQIIKRAQREDRPPGEVAQQYEQAHWQAMEGLGVLRPTHTPHATEYVEDMVDLIRRLFDAGFAYTAPDGVYFAAEAVDGYGLLARQSLDSLRAGARVEAVEGKRSPMDFVLWKLAKPGEPSWASPWGPGRPGWHTECVVMSLDLLGDGFDLHTGGLDLQFPHHENERAQAVALGKRFARHWMHHAFVEVAGEKMSKSLGNFTSLADLLARTDGRAYRLLVVQSHYRSPLEVTAGTISRAEKTLRRFDDFAERFGSQFAPLGGSGTGPDGGPAFGELPTLAAAYRGPAEREALNRFRSAMDSDLDTPRAAALVFDLITRANAAADAGRNEEAEAAAAAVANLAGALGLFAKTTVATDVDADQMAARIDQARAQKDYETADALRAELAARGYAVENTAAGTKVRRGT